MFKNRVEIVVKSQEGELLHSYAEENAAADDFLAPSGRLFMNAANITTGSLEFAPWLFLLPDGSPWTSGEWTAEGGSGTVVPTTPPWRTNPWAPLTSTNSNTAIPTANVLYTGLSKSGYSGNESANTSNLHNPDSTNSFRWKMFFSFNQLPYDLQLKAVGLTGLQADTYNSTAFGIAGNAVPLNFVPETLIIIPTSFLVHGVSGSTNIPDVLEVSYYLSVIGAA